MRIALIGAGKTGREVISLCDHRRHHHHGKNHDFDELIGPFTEQDNIKEYMPRIEREADAVLVFVPGHAMAEIIPHLLTLTKPVLIGTTGFIWTQEVLDQLSQNKKIWIHATNFSLGMSVVRDLFKTLTVSSSRLTHPKMHIKETHHIHKKDAPSGTALSWQKWLSGIGEGKVTITSHREGDVVGLHHLTLSTDTEDIEIIHHAKTRAIFAEGAVWAAHRTATHPPKNYGLTLFEDWLSEK